LNTRSFILQCSYAEADTLCIEHFYNGERKKEKEEMRGWQGMERREAREKGGATGDEMRK